MQAFGWRLHFLHYAVDPKTDAKFLIHRFEVNIARAQAVGLDQQHRDHPNDGSICFIACNWFRAVADFETKIDICPDFFLQHVRGFVGRAVVLDKRLANFLRTGADQFELALKQKTQTVDGIDIERVAHRNNESRFTESHGNHLEPPRFFRANLFDSLRRNDHG